MWWERRQSDRGIGTFRGIERIIVTLGSKGSVCVTPEIKERFGTFPTTQVDATGTGDFFTAAIAYGVATGQSIEDSITLATRPKQ